MFWILLIVSLLIFTLAAFGNTQMLRYSIFRVCKNSSVSDKILLCLCISNTAACFIALPTHVIKLILDNEAQVHLTPYFCIVRYFFTMVTNDFSLLFLTGLIISRKDKITKEPFGIPITFSNKNLSKWLCFASSWALIPNIMMACVYFYFYEVKKIEPCEKNLEKSTLQTVVNIFESVKAGCIAVPSITVMLRSIRQLYQMLKKRDDKTRRMKTCLRKVKICFLYAAAFMTFWFPFGGMVLSSSAVSKDKYNLWFNIGYTVAYGYLAAIPIIYRLTDLSFRTKHYSVGKRSSAVKTEIKTETKTRFVHIEPV